MVTLLRDIAVDPSEPIGADNPFRQVAINTHSPDVLRACDPREVIHVGSEAIKYEGATGQITAIRVPDASWRRSKDRAKQLLLAIGQLQPYAPLSEAWQQLQLPDLDKK